MHLEQFPSNIGHIAQASRGPWIPFGCKEKKKMGLRDFVDLLSPEDRSGVDERGGAKCSRLRWVVYDDMNAEVDVNGV